MILKPKTKSHMFIEMVAILKLIDCADGGNMSNYCFKGVELPVIHDVLQNYHRQIHSTDTTISAQLDNEVIKVIDNFYQKMYN